jgi:tryptophan synthase, alpha chain (EC 4.2.1.20)
MERLALGFERLHRERRKALIPFIVAGDPGLAATVPAMHALVEAGADVIELGMPFSDPMADGPVIQRASERAIAAGGGLDHALRSVREFRTRDDRTPVVLMGYLNPIEIRGVERFAREAADCGVDGVLPVDLPVEEAAPLQAGLADAGVALIRLVAPTTTADRLGRLAAGAEGYLYYVSYAGVTGAARLDPEQVAARLAEVKAISPVPVVAGFGVKDAAGAARLGSEADGVVVGSALVEALAGAAGPDEAALRAVPSWHPCGRLWTVNTVGWARLSR